MGVLFLTFSAMGANPKKTTLHGGQSRSWSAKQGKKIGLVCAGRNTPNKQGMKALKLLYYIIIYLHGYGFSTPDHSYLGQVPFIVVVQDH